MKLIWKLQYSQIRIFYLKNLDREELPYVDKFPVSPFKPFQVDRADICYYSEDSIKDGTMPNVLIELKKGRAGTRAIGQVERYLRWLHLVLGKETSKILVYILAPSFACTEQSLPMKYRSQVHLVKLNTEGYAQSQFAV